MKTLNFLISSILVLLSHSCVSQDAEKNFASLSSHVSENDASIQQTILDNIFNLHPIEYAYALPELCQLIKDNKVSIKTWKLYIDSLNTKSEKIDQDTITSIYGVNTKGLIQKQILFFIRTIKNNSELIKKYPSESDKLLKNTFANPSKISDAPIADILKISDVVGETNFWYFLQIDGCLLIKKIVQEKAISNEALKIISSNLGIVSTYRTPYSLQKRKLKDLQLRLTNSGDTFCKELSNLMNKRIITIEDKNKNFFKEHPDWNLIRTF